MSFGSLLYRRRVYFLIAAGLLVADQTTKILAHRFLRGAGSIEVLPGWVNLWYSRNAGGLFGYFADWSEPWRMLLLTALPVVAIVLIGRFILQTAEEDRLTLGGLALILGGAVGNLIDRALRGEVVDFLDVYASSPRLAGRLVDWFGTAHWPTFNLADSGIVVGAGRLLLNLLRPGAQRAGAGDPLASLTGSDRRDR
jgi:signal peptidase II